MSVTSLYTFLPKNQGFVTQKLFSQYFPILRELYIERSLLVIHGQLIEGSGLVKIFTENKFSMIGFSAVVGVNNLKRVRNTLQITLCALVIKLLSNNMVVGWRYIYTTSSRPLYYCNKIFWCLQLPFKRKLFIPKALSGVFNNEFGSNLWAE